MKVVLRSYCQAVGQKIKGVTGSVIQWYKQSQVRQAACLPGSARKRPGRLRVPLAMLGLVLLVTFLALCQNVIHTPAASGTTPSTPAKTAPTTVASQLSTLPLAQRISLTLQAAPETTALSLPASAARQPSQARNPSNMRANAGSCNENKPLNDSSQRQLCDWNYQYQDTTSGAPAGSTQWIQTLLCEPGATLTKDNWSTTNPLPYKCAVGYFSITNYYCLVPANITLSQLTNIRCSTTDGGTLLSCFYNWTDIGECNDPCTTANPPTFDPVTGIPMPSTDTSQKVTSCPITVPTVCAAAFDTVNDWIFGTTQGLLYPSSTSQTGQNTTTVQIVQDAWGVIAGISLALLAIPFLLAGYQIMRGLGSENQARAIDLLGRVVLVAAAIALSLFIISRMVELEDGLSQSFAKTFKPADNTYVSMSSSNWQCYTQQFFGTLFNMNVDSTNNAAGGNGDTTKYTSNMDTATLTLIENLPHYILTLLSILLAVQLAVRLALLNLHIVLSPLTILCSALPGQIGPSAATHWVKGFVSLLFVQALQLMVLTLGSHLIPIPTNSTGVDWATTLFTNILPVAVMIMTLNIPRLFNVPATTLLSTVSSSIGGTMNGIALIIRGL